MYAMKPRKYCAGLSPPVHDTAPPLSQPASTVRVEAIRVIQLLGFSNHLCWIESSVWKRWRSGSPRTSVPSAYWLKIRIVLASGVQRTWPPMPGQELNRPYDCQPLISHGSIFRRSEGNHCSRTPLKNHGVFDDTYDGW